MKSKTIKESADNEAAFTAMVAGLTGEALDALRAASEGDETLSRAFAFIMDERAMSGADFARELQGDFAPEKVVNVNNPKDLENRQIELNALEDRDNEIRVIFAVDMQLVTPLLIDVFGAAPAVVERYKSAVFDHELFQTGICS